METENFYSVLVLLASQNFIDLVKVLKVSRCDHGLTEVIVLGCKFRHFVKCHKGFKIDIESCEQISKPWQADSFKSFNHFLLLNYSILSKFK